MRAKMNKDFHKRASQGAKVQYYITVQLNLHSAERNIHTITIILLKKTLEINEILYDVGIIITIPLQLLPLRANIRVLRAMSVSSVLGVINLWGLPKRTSRVARATQTAVESRSDV